ncbi:hypothetical protein KP79_PYT24871 [Mizuhopecten yessoensis]|uniref:Uncharacterized protein n=1 Tax=Mizuhopecten yessoensis TaxID=6573 RepID=A0A210PDK4_MIZYE|nr:hypothetical protein KP79_PYT24871 [Mizuhopecten yessoensis]
MFLLLKDYVLAIDCYVCSSLQHGNRDCEDKFDQNLKTSVFIARSCDFGFFKATHCIKLKGTRGLSSFFSLDLST